MEQRVAISCRVSTDTASGKLMRTIMAGLAEFEPDLIRERIRVLEWPAFELGLSVTGIS
jgi:hypothetical protein